MLTIYVPAARVAGIVTVAAELPLPAVSGVVPDSTLVFEAFRME